MRPVGRPSHKPVVWYQGFLYQAASWKTAQRVVAKAEFRAGNWITEGKQAATMTRLSCHRFRSNEAWLGSA